MKSKKKKKIDFRGRVRWKTERAREEAWDEYAGNDAQLFTAATVQKQPDTIWVLCSANDLFPPTDDMPAYLPPHSSPDDTN